VKTTVSIPGHLFRAARRAAQRLGISRKQFYRLAIERHVQASAEGDVTALLNRVYERENSELDPVLEALQSESIPREKW
jgi:hypothetical protein